LFTYASPRLGCQKFVHAFQHLERIGKLRYGRFTNTRDLVPLVPFHGMSRAYKHVGMHVCLHDEKMVRRSSLDVSYPKHHGILPQAWRGLKCSLISNVNSLQGFKRVHTLSEYQSRIRFSYEYRSILAQADGTFYNPKRSRKSLARLDSGQNDIKTLDEYYISEGACMTSCTGDRTRTPLENEAKRGVRMKIIIVLVMIALLEAFILISVMKKSSVQGVTEPVLGQSYLSSLPQKTQLKNWLDKIVPKTPQIHLSSELPQKTPSNNHMAQKVIHNDIESKLKPTHESDTTHESDMTVEDQPEDAASNQKDLEPKLSPGVTEIPTKSSKKHTTYAREKISFWMKLLRKAPNPYHEGAPCVWGYCYFIHQRHLPWGVRTEETSLHAIESSHSKLELSWDVDTMFQKEDIHLKASNIILANAREL